MTYMVLIFMFFFHTANNIIIRIIIQDIFTFNLKIEITTYIKSIKLL